MTTDIKELKRLASSAEPYGYVLKTGHGTAFRETLAGVKPDFVKHWVRVYTDPPVIQTEQDSNKEPLVWESTTPCYTRFISEARYQKFSPEVRAWYRPVCEKCGAIDSNKDAERYRKAIAYEDNAGLLYCAVMNHCPDKAAIDAEFDAEAIDIAIANGAPVDKG